MEGVAVAQVRLMQSRCTPSAVAAMDAHRVVATVAESGLRFLCSLSVSEGNKVMIALALCGGSYLGQQGARLHCAVSGQCARGVHASGRYGLRWLGRWS